MIPVFSRPLMNCFLLSPSAVFLRTGSRKSAKGPPCIALSPEIWSNRYTDQVFLLQHIVNLRWLCNTGMFDNSYSQICQSKHFQILFRINLNYKYQVLYSSITFVSAGSSVGYVAASRAEGPVFQLSSDNFIHDTFFHIGFLGL